MVVAYIMVKANTSEADRMKQELAAIDGVVEAHIVAGDVDFIVKLDVPDPTAVKDIAADAVQNVGGVETTQTYLSMD